MHGQCLVAVFPSRNEAEQACRAAIGSGIPSGNIRISGARPHVWDWLFSRHVPERDKTYYRTHLAEGRTAVSVLLDGDSSPSKIDAVEQVLERYHPVDVHVETEGQGATAAASGAVKAPSEAEALRARGAPRAAPQGEEQVIPLPREELNVGVRAADRVLRIRTYVVEEPIEKEVSLRDEQVVVETRPATTRGAPGEISERDYEIHERYEEPVVEKTTRADEELVVRKEPSQHTERVRGTVRKTKADVEKRPSGPPASMKGR